MLGVGGGARMAGRCIITVHTQHLQENLPVLS